MLALILLFEGNTCFETALFDLRDRNPHYFIDSLNAQCVRSHSKVFNINTQFGASSMAVPTSIHFITNQESLLLVGYIQEGNGSGKKLANFALRASMDDSTLHWLHHYAYGN